MSQFLADDCLNKCDIYHNFINTETKNVTVGIITTQGHSKSLRCINKRLTYRFVLVHSGL